MPLDCCPTGLFVLELSRTDALGGSDVFGGFGGGTTAALVDGGFEAGVAGAAGPAAEMVPAPSLPASANGAGRSQLLRGTPPQYV